MQKEKVLIIFTDLDETFIPIGLKGMKKFVDLVKEIEAKEGVKVKYCPISGRQSTYVLAIMDVIKAVFEEGGIKNAVDYGVGEQGAVVAHIDSYCRQDFLGAEEDKDIKSKILQAFNEFKYKDYFTSMPGFDYMYTFYIKDELVKSLSQEKRNKLLSLLRKHLSLKLKDKVNISDVIDCLEVVSKGTGKDKAIKWALSKYSRKYDVVGLCYSGDSENDLKAVSYVSKLAEIPGIKANVFLPANAYECLKSKNVEAWKRKIESVFSGYKVHESKEKRFEGVMKLIRQKLKEGNLVSHEPRPRKTQDDMAIIYKRNKVKVDLRKKRTDTKTREIFI